MESVLGLLSARPMPSQCRISNDGMGFLSATTKDVGRPSDTVRDRNVCRVSRIPTSRE